MHSEKEPASPTTEGGAVGSDVMRGEEGCRGPTEQRPRRLLTRPSKWTAPCGRLTTGRRNPPIQNALRSCEPEAGAGLVGVMSSDQKKLLPRLSSHAPTERIQRCQKRWDSSIRLARGRLRLIFGGDVLTLCGLQEFHTGGAGFLECLEVANVASAVFSDVGPAPAGVQQINAALRGIGIEGL